MRRREFIHLSAALSLTVGLRPRLLLGSEAASWPDDPFLTGPFAPVFDELDVADLPVEGEIPADLYGMYVRNGPNPQFPPLGAYHWFDGDGMLHGVWLEEGRASYRNRWVMTEGLRLEREAGEALWPGINGRQRDRRAPRGSERFKNSANTNVVWHGGRLLALWEGGDPHALTVPELDTVGPWDFEGSLDHAFTAHPKIDPRTGELVAFGYDLIRAPHLSYSVFDAGGRRIHTTPIDIPNPVMMHDFAITERHTLFLDLPVKFNLRRAIFGRPPLEFVAKLGARIGVLARHAPGEDVRWFEVAPCYVFHTLGAWEEGDEIILLGCRFETFPDFAMQVEDTREPTSRDPAYPYLYEWRLNLATGAVKEGWRSERTSEFPRIDERRTGAPTRYAFAAAGTGGAWMKIDLEGGREERHEHGPGRTAGEGVFVPRRGGVDSDDGYFMGYVHDAQDDSSHLEILDARDLSAPPLARIRLPQRVPHGFHGTFVPGEEALGEVAAG